MNVWTLNFKSYCKSLSVSGLPLGMGKQGRLPEGLTRTGIVCCHRCLYLKKKKPHTSQWIAPISKKYYKYLSLNTWIIQQYNMDLKFSVKSRLRKPEDSKEQRWEHSQVTIYMHQEKQSNDKKPGLLLEHFGVSSYKRIMITLSTGEQVELKHNCSKRWYLNRPSYANLITIVTFSLV